VPIQFGTTTGGLTFGVVFHVTVLPVESLTIIKVNLSFPHTAGLKDMLALAVTFTK